MEACRIGCPDLCGSLALFAVFIPAFSALFIETRCFPGVRTLCDFFAEKDFDGLNITIPYKTAVMQYLDEISPEAEKMGAVNTVVNRGGRLCGYNTDYYGFCYQIKEIPFYF